MIHLPGPLDPTGVQRCTRCGLVLTDWRGAMVPDTDTRPLSGWAEGVPLDVSLAGRGVTCMIVAPAARPDCVVVSVNPPLARRLVRGLLLVALVVCSAVDGATQGNPYRRRDPATVTLGATTVAAATSPIVSVQYGTITITGSNTSATATITSVNTATSVALVLGETLPNTGSFTSDEMSLALTNQTTLTATRVGNAISSPQLQYVVVEWATAVVQSRQTFAIAMTAGNGSGTATISSVATAKTVLFWAGNTTTNATNIDSDAGFYTLTNATTVTASRPSTVGTLTLYGTALEFQ